MDESISVVVMYNNFSNIWPERILRWYEFLKRGINKQATLSARSSDNFHKANCLQISVFPEKSVYPSPRPFSFFVFHVNSRARFPIFKYDSSYIYTSKARHSLPFSCSHLVALPHHSFPLIHPHPPSTTMASTDLTPKGDPVIKTVPAGLPSPNQTLTSTLSTIHSSANSISLIPLHPSHAPELFTNLGGLPNAHLYTYMPADALLTLPQFSAHIDTLLSFPNWLSYAVFSSSPNHLSNSPSLNPEGKPTAIGIISLLNIQPAHLSVEIGHVLFPTTCHRSSESTAINYVLMKYVFEELGYERVEWKCNIQNGPSRRAAERLGYKHEGVFRRHMVLKGVWRDTVSPLFLLSRTRRCGL